MVWFPPGEKHWHGVAPTTALTHIAIAEALDGKVVEAMTARFADGDDADEPAVMGRIAKFLKKLR